MNREQPLVFGSPIFSFSHTHGPARGSSPGRTIQAPPENSILPAAKLLHRDGGRARVAIHSDARFRPLPHKHATTCRTVFSAMPDWSPVIKVELPRPDVRPMTATASVRAATEPAVA